jgi:hypothetical protein
MLNKGRYVGTAVSVLDDILTRMQSHQNKKTSQLRELHVWQHPALNVTGRVDSKNGTRIELDDALALQ